MSDKMTTWTRSEAFPVSGDHQKIVNHFGISGGKDSTALLLWAIHESGYPRESLNVSFCDTGNESPITLDYVRYLEQHLQIGITWIKPAMQFYELARHKKRFPSAKARFCTYDLKIKPTIDYINSLFRCAGDGFASQVTLHSGVRAAESTARAKMLEREYDGNFMCEIVRPLLHLSISDIWAMHDKYGVKPNPLYIKGMTRVGCFPCIMSRKSEIAAIARHFPDRIDLLREAEQVTGSDHHAGMSSFFRSDKTPKRFHSKVYVREKDGAKFTLPTIDDVVAWSQSSECQDPRIQPAFDFEYDKLPSEEDEGRCNSSIGFCE